MIIARTPLRISFTWGGSDLPSFYTKFGGAVISTSIDKYIYITINKKFDNDIRLGYSKTEIVDNVDKIQHERFREMLKYLHLVNGIEITSIADIPSKGSWLWSSSAFCVWTLQALYAYTWKYVSPEQLAQEACMIEIEKCWEPIGKQDQYAAAYGWLNFIKFNTDGTVSVEPIICLNETKKKLEDNLIMLYTGITRDASSILSEQNKNMISDENKQEIMKKMVKLTYDLKQELENNNLNNFGEILHKNRLLKKEMSGGVSSPKIDEWYDKAMRAWALWWKLLGAWGWGFLLFYVPKDRQTDVYTALHDLKKVKFNFDSTWSKIIFIH